MAGMPLLLSVVTNKSVRNGNYRQGNYCPAVNSICDWVIVTNKSVRNGNYRQGNYCPAVNSDVLFSESKDQYIVLDLLKYPVM